MQRYILRRLAQSAVTVLGVSAIIFIMVRVVGDPAVLLLPPEGRVTQAEVATLRRELGLDRPLHVQYLVFLGRALQGDLGHSFRWDQPALKLILDRMPATLQLTGAAMALALAIGLTVGILSAVRPGGFMDSFGKLFALLGQSVPSFWLGLMLIWAVAVYWKVLPTSGQGTWQHLVMPSFTLGWFSMAAITRLSRSSMLDVLGGEYIKMARIKGVPERLVIWKHALKNAAIPVVTLLAIQLIVLLSGSVVIETVFAWPGLGRLVVEAIFTRDYPVVQAAVLLTSVLFVTVNLLVDVLYGYLDPRIRYE